MAICMIAIAPRMIVAKLPRLAVSRVMDDAGIPEGAFNLFSGEIAGRTTFPEGGLHIPARLERLPAVLEDGVENILIVEPESTCVSRQILESPVCHIRRHPGIPIDHQHPGIEVGLRNRGDFDRHRRVE